MRRLPLAGQGGSRFERSRAPGFSGAAEEEPRAAADVEKGCGARARGGGLGEGELLQGRKDRALKRRGIVALRPPSESSESSESSDVPIPQLAVHAFLLRPRKVDLE